MPDIFFQGSSYQASAQACIADLTPPTFGGITGLTARPNGALRASWSSGSDANSPISYEVYIQKDSATGLFNLANVVAVTRKLTIDIFQDALGALLLDGGVYHVGVRAVDPVGNRSVNTGSMSATSQGVPDDNCASLITKVLQYQADVAQYAADVAAFNTNVDGYRDDVVDYVADVAAYSTAVAGFNTNVTGYRNDVVTYRGEVNHYAADVAAYSGNVDDYRDEVVAFNTNVTGYRNDVVGYVSAVAGYSANVDGYRADVVAYSANVDDYQNDVAQYSANVDAYRDEVVAFNTAVTQLRIDGTGLVGVIESDLLVGSVEESP